MISGLIAQPCRWPGEYVRGAGDENRTRTTSLGNRAATPERAADLPVRVDWSQCHVVRHDRRCCACDGCGPRGADSGLRTVITGGVRACAVRGGSRS